MFSIRYVKFINLTRFVSFFQFQVPSGDQSPSSNQEYLQLFYDLLIQSIDILKTWAERIPGFTDLCKEDQDLLFQSATLELFVLRIAFR